MYLQIGCFGKHKITPNRIRIKSKPQDLKMSLQEIHKEEEQLNSIRINSNHMWKILEDKWLAILWYKYKLDRRILGIDKRDLRIKSTKCYVWIFYKY